MPQLGFAVAFATLFLAGCVFDPPTKGGSPEPPAPIDSYEAVIQALQRAYQDRKYEDFANLLPRDEDHAPYHFFLNEPLPDGTTNWDATEELKIHRRMFDPNNVLPGESQVNPDYWLVSISISLTRTSNFAPRPDLYQPTTPDGLDPDVWEAQEAQYDADITFKTQGPNDFRVQGKANFIVINNKTKAVGENRKFLIYRWEDLGSTSPKPAVAAGSPVPAL